MSNLPKGVLAFSAGDQTYKLVFDMNALCELEDEFGVSIAEIGEKLKSAKALRTVFRIGLSRHHDGLTDDDAGDIITAVGMARASEMVGEAFAAANPPAQGSKGKARPRTGAASTT